MIGQMLNGRYRLDEELGRGGTGVVYRARDLVLERDVAVKVLHQAGADAPGQARLLREAQSAARLHHPNIVALFDVSENPELAFIVMEYVKGRSLRDCGGRETNEMLPLLRQVCAALQHAHEHGIIHRDLKPENIVITPEGVVKLMDFGLARSEDAPRITSEGTLVGTFAYLAPELIQGQPASAQSDLYALGVILYECVTGQPPFAGGSMMELLSQHLYASVVPPSSHLPGIAPELETLILRLLEKQPGARPASAAEVIHTLDMLINEPGTAGRGTRSELSLLDRLVRGRIVGREQELEQAGALWQQVLAGEPVSRVLLVSGEPGIGKTRLVRELTALAQVWHANTLSGACYAEGAAPFAPISQVIQAAFEQIALARTTPPAPVLADLITLVSPLRASYPDIPMNPPLEPRAEQQRLYESVATLLLSLAPLLLVVEDVHWADGGTLAMLRHLARRASATRAPLMIVLTYREVELDEARALTELLHDLNRERLATRLKLVRLSLKQTDDLLMAILAERPSAEFLEGIYRETEGNPFFVEEVCKALIEDGKLYRADGRWQRPAMEEIEIPQSIHVAIQTRVNRLPEVAQETLRLAAILGREFDFGALHLMSGLEEDVLIDSLELAERAQLVAEVRPSGTGHAQNRTTYTFAHALIPASLGETLSGLRRQRLHRRAAEALERLYPDQKSTRELAPQLGRHYTEAGDWERAAGYWLEAGTRAREVYAYSEAIQYLQQALSILKERTSQDLDRAARTAMKLGMLYHTLFEYPRARQAFQEAFNLWLHAAAQPQQVLPPAPHPYRQVWTTNIETLDPAVANDAQSISLIEQLFCGLVELNSELDVVPALARSWEFNAGGCEYRFRLRGDARWSDGAPLTAHDFEYAWKRVLAPEQRSPFAEMLLDIKGARAYHNGETADADTVGVQALDDQTLLVELGEPVGHFLYLLTVSMAFAVPRHTVQTWGDAWTEPGHIVTSGPFILKMWQPGERILFERNPDYRGRYTGNLAQVDLRLFQDTSQDKLELYQANLLDMITLSTASQVEWGCALHPADYKLAPLALTQYLGFDTAHKPFDDRRVRQALIQAVDRQYFADSIWQGMVNPATGGLVPPGIPGYSPSIGLAYDPERARRLLAEAGYPGGDGFPEIEALTTDTALFVDTTDFIAECWRRQLGLNITWQHLNWLDYKTRISQAPSPHIMTMGWAADYPDPETYLAVAMHQPYCSWHHSQYEQYLAQARRMADEVERFKFYQAAERLLIEEAAIWPIYYAQLHLLLKPWIQHYPLSSCRISFWRDVIIAQH